MTLQLRYVVLLAFDPARTAATVLSAFDFCSDPAARGPRPARVDFAAVCGATGNKPGAHYLRLAADERTLLLTDSFIVLGNADFAGSRSAHAFAVRKDASGEIASPAFDPASPPGRPHGLVQGVWSDGGPAGR